MAFGLGLQDLPNVCRQAAQAERLGFDFVFAGEHVRFHRPTGNAFITLSAAAGATERIGLLSAVTLLPLYPAVLAAKMATVLDVVSGGRFHLGIGVGGESPVEFAAVGVPVNERGRRTDDALAAIRGLLAGDSVTHHGAFTEFEDLALLPGPARPGGPPVWIAGRRAAAVRRAARFGDVWMPYLVDPERFGSTLADVRRQATELGRTAIPRGAVYTFLTVHPDGDHARRRVREVVGEIYHQDFSRLAHYLVAGNPAECVARLREYQAAGATAVQINLACSAEERDAMAELVAAEILPAFGPPQSSRV